MTGSNAWQMSKGINWTLDKPKVEEGNTVQDIPKAVSTPEKISSFFQNLFRMKVESDTSEVVSVSRLSDNSNSPIQPILLPTPTPFGLDVRSIHRRKVKLFNHIKTLILSDLKSATFIAYILGTDVVGRRQPKEIRCSYPHQPIQTLTELENLALGFDLMSSRVKYSSGVSLWYSSSWDETTNFDPYAHPNPDKTLHTLACTIKPKNVCSTWCRGLERPFDRIFFRRLEELTCLWNLESFTWHSKDGLIDRSGRNSGSGTGLSSSNETRPVTSFFPPKIPLFTAFNHKSLTERCMGKKEDCECGKALRGILVHLNSENWSDEEKNQERKVELIGYPCLIGISIDEILDAVVQSQIYLEKEDHEIEQAKMGWKSRREWLENNFSIMKVDEAKECICCGNT
ncbi:uncharacterized protein L201_001506 [Kwoniella dendrophila CBS 6074]|uniref:Uncharacterized protein n=1 Tax=Kwoniella dendrophila CBS 6074 TaxID=1295534 RepID=A0AAX4JNZ6_9TREE